MAQHELSCTTVVETYRRIGDLLRLYGLLGPLAKVLIDPLLLVIDERITLPLKERWG